MEGKKAKSEETKEEDVVENNESETNTATGEISTGEVTTSDNVDEKSPSEPTENRFSGRGRSGGFKGRGRGRFEEKKEWLPKTELGKDVLAGKYKTVDEILEKGLVILEPEIIDTLIPDIREEVMYIGGSPGKGGGIRRTATKRTARMHKSGRRFKLTGVVAIGNDDGIIGMGKANSREHRTSLEKSAHQAKLNIIRVRRGCGSWECGCGGDHSIPFRSTAKLGSITVELLPAPKGTGIVADKTTKSILRLSGIKDVWVRTSGQTSTRNNLAFAVFDAIKKLNRTKGDL